MRVECHETTPPVPTLAKRWDFLAGESFFRSWTWQSTWQQYYVAGANSKTDGARPGKLRELRVFTVIDDDNPNQPIVAILPCYLERTLLRGRVLRLCGDGEVCSEHLGLLTSESDSVTASQALAEHLACRDDWDLLEFDFLDADDPQSLRLAEALQACDCQVIQQTGPQCWAIDLPDSWEAFLEMQSKSHRKHLRRLMRSEVALQAAEWHPVEAAEAFPAAWETFVDLHQRRRRSLGEPGCFASPLWATFHKCVARKLLEAGQLRLSYLTLDNAPAAVEYQFASQTTTYAYQGGLDPDRLDKQAGRMSLVHSIKQAIAQRHDRFDLLRGDEPYKAHWRAQPNPTLRLLAVPQRISAKWRHQAWHGLRQVKQMTQQAASLLG